MTDHPVEPLPRDVVDECRFFPTGSRLALTAESWYDPRGVWSIELASCAATPLSSTGSHTLASPRGASTPSVNADELTSPELRRLRSVDGLELTGWLYRPQGPGPWPTMIHLHGGPEAQERPVYNSLFQSLVAAGVAVFAPNVRGSSGFRRSVDRSAGGGPRRSGYQRPGGRGRAGRRRAGRARRRARVSAPSRRGSRAVGHPEPGDVRAGNGGLGTST